MFQNSLELLVFLQIQRLKDYIEVIGSFIKLKKKFPQFIKTFPVKKIELSNTIKHKFSNLKIIGFIVHPFIRKKLNIFLRRNRGKKIVVLDIPLYLENKMNKKNDVIVFLKTKKKMWIKN